MFRNSPPRARWNEKAAVAIWFFYIIIIIIIIIIIKSISKARPIEQLVTDLVHKKRQS